MTERYLGVFRDRIQVSSLLIVTSFIAVLGLSSQSAASWPTYLLALSVFFSARSWDDVLAIPYFQLIAAQIGYLVLSALWSPAFALADFGGIAARGVLILFFVIACAECEHRGELRRWLGRSLAIVATVAAGAAIFVQIALPDYFPGNRLHGLGQLDNPVIAGLIYGASLVILLDMMWRDAHQRWRVFGALSALILAVAILMTDSRSAWLSVSVGLFAYVLASSVRDRQRFLATVASLAVVFGITLIALLDEQGVREAVFPRGTSYRLDIWAQTVSRVLAEGNLFLGLGIVTPDLIRVGDLEFQHPHSLYLSVFFQGGLVGLALLLALVLWTLRNLLVHYAQPEAKLGIALFAIALLGYLLDGHELVDKVSDIWFLFWLPVAISLGLEWRSSTSREEDP